MEKNFHKWTLSEKHGIPFSLKHIMSEDKIFIRILLAMK